MQLNSIEQFIASDRLGFLVLLAEGAVLLVCALILAGLAAWHWQQWREQRS